jgi:acetoacetyl-CoA reductase
MRKTVLVTGGIRGIGAAISKLFHVNDYQVIANYVSHSQEAQLFHEETRIPIYRWDVGDFEACTHWVAHIEKSHGPIDILVNNAGICDSALVSRMTIDQWQKVLRVNLDSVFYMSKLVIEGMCQRGYGRIISIGSMNGSRSEKGIANYSAAKAGLIGFTKALAHEVAAYGVTANVVAPGYIRTSLVENLSPHILENIMKQVPLKRMGIPEEVAAAVFFLASSSASFMTGSTLHLNGGHWMN